MDFKGYTINTTGVLVEFPTRSGGGGSGTVTDFVFTDGSGFDGTVTNSTTTPTLSIGLQYNFNFVTDAEKVVIGNTSGTNTGDNATNTQYSGLAASKLDIPTGTPDGTKYLRDDNSWQPVSGGSGLSQAQVLARASIGF